jgi:hypothetical protein
MGDECSEIVCCPFMPGHKSIVIREEKKYYNPEIWLVPSIPGFLLQDNQETTVSGRHFAQQVENQAQHNLGGGNGFY